MMERFHPDEIADMQAEMRLARPEAQRPVEAATLTVLRGGVPVVGWEAVPCVVETPDPVGDNPLQIEVLVTIRQAVLPAAVLPMTATVQLTHPHGATVTYQPIRPLQQADALGTTWRLELKRPTGVAR